jgi:hypothetical protein
MNDVQHRKYHATPFKNGARRARNAFGNPWDAEAKSYFSLR